MYRDRHLGWRRVMVTMQWLRQHFHPQEVSGRRHRYELFVAMRYAAECTDTQVRRGTSRSPRHRSNVADDE